VHSFVAESIHCINPNCPAPYPQPRDNNFCNGCGAKLRLKNRYFPLQLLGSGGFANIYTVWDLQSKTEKVLKVLLDTKPKVLQLFQQEADVLQRLDHPGIPKVEQDSYFVINLGLDLHPDLHCLVMEKINGSTLEQMLMDHAQGCPEMLVRDWLYQAAEILQVLHSCGVIHRDIKPSNLMLRQTTGELVAIDFGGAKQLSVGSELSQEDSTRLITPGYSPPEQIAGAAIGPAADFYALSRTMIHLLTGIELKDLQHPVTGEFRWREQAVVSHDLADLLDEMLSVVPQQRPTTTIEIHLRLGMTPSPSYQPTPAPVFSSAPVSSFQGNQVAALGLSSPKLTQSVTGLTHSITSVKDSLLAVVITIALACLDSVWEMFLGAFGGVFCATVGFMVLNWTSVGKKVTNWLSGELSMILPSVQTTMWQEMLLFGAAGLGTAWGLTAAGGFGQQRRFLVAGIMGIFGYSLGWLMWQATVPTLLFVSNVPDQGLLIWITAVTVMLLVLGLGLPSHNLIHALVVAAGTGGVFGGLVSSHLLPPGFVVNIFSFSRTGKLDFYQPMAFFAMLAILEGFWLGVSYYLLVPVMRWFGWR